MKQKSELRKAFVILMIAGHSFFFLAAGMIPIIGPSIVAFITGKNKYKNALHEISKAHFFISLLISELVLFIFSLPIYYILSGFYVPQGYWLFIVFALVVNTISAIIFFFLGDYLAKKRRWQSSKGSLEIY